MSQNSENNETYLVQVSNTDDQGALCQVLTGSCMVMMVSLLCKDCLLLFPTDLQQIRLHEALILTVRSGEMAKVLLLDH